MHRIDFAIKERNSFAIVARLLDERRALIAPIDGAIGRFALIAPDGTVSQRDSTQTSHLVWFTMDPWKLWAAVQAEDLPAPGVYGYEMRLDADTLMQKVTIRKGHFRAEESLFQ